MSDIVDQAVKALNEKIEGGFDAGSAKFVITDEGSVVVDANGAREADVDADVTLTADLETFQGIIEGDVNPTAAFMQGKLTVEGDMGMAMQLGAALA
ncbi:putative sterol carrier protein [Pacificibacter maritimus]|uniref:Putative sterol carrier protein n=1 Tax=Pacificibacter maritimus TaxID=762213 RepID=A0A3N4UWN8_9RHOB|nr:SCP2 sterol-binding domain-containing protein [Pacificibacter maritimus]RPE71971.1 putative sterol carrier protein [Pacificibacter maritimus]